MNDKKTAVAGQSVLIDGELCKITARDWTEETSPCLINHNGENLPPFTVRAYRCCFDIVRGGAAARLVVMPPWLTSNTAHMNPVAVTTIPAWTYKNGLDGGGGTYNALVRFAEMDVARRCFVEILPITKPAPAPTETAVIIDAVKAEGAATRETVTGGFRGLLEKVGLIRKRASFPRVSLKAQNRAAALWGGWSGVAMDTGRGIAKVDCFEYYKTELAGHKIESVEHFKAVIDAARK